MVEGSSNAGFRNSSFKEQSAYIDIRVLYLGFLWKPRLFTMRMPVLEKLGRPLERMSPLSTRKFLFPFVDFFLRPQLQSLCAHCAIDDDEYRFLEYDYAARRLNLTVDL
jgi:hypothetical protein